MVDGDNSDTQAQIRSWLQSHGGMPEFPVCHLGAGVFNGYSMGFFPHNVVIDAGMIVRYTNYGFNENAIRNTIESYLLAPYYPFLTMIDHDLMEFDGDEDGLLNPGEQGSLTVTFHNNVLYQPADSVWMELVTEDSRITIISDRVEVENMTPGTYGESVVPLIFEISPDADISTANCTLIVHANDHTEYPYIAEFEIEIPVTLDQQGFPMELGVSVKTSPAMIDLNGDNLPEIIFGTDENHLFVLDGSTGENLPGFPLEFSAKIISSPAVADLDEDGEPEIIFGGWDNYLYAYNIDGTQFFEPVDLTYRAGATPAIGNITDAPGLEIAIGNFRGKVFVVQADGTIADGFPIDLGTSHRISKGVALGDVNQDGNTEIVFGTWELALFCYGNDGQQIWNFPAYGDFKAAPSIGDFNQDGIVEVLAGSDDGIFHCLNGSDGNEIWQTQLDDEILSAPSFFDIDQDGSFEIFVGSTNHLNGLDGTGNSLNGWPVETGFKVESSAIFADINNDNLMEVIWTSYDDSLYISDLQGNIIRPTPVNTGNEISVTPAVGDIDGDGDAEIAFGNNNGLEVIDLKSRCGILNQGWNTYRGSLLRDGNLKTVYPVLSAFFTADPVRGDAPLNVSFQHNSSLQPDSYFWDFGDGSVSTEAYPQHIYETPGYFSVSLIVSKGTLSDTVINSAMIEVTERLEAGFSNEIQSGLFPLPVQFSSNITGNPDSVCWDFGDGSVSYDNNPLHIYEFSGIFDVSLIAFRNSETDSFCVESCVTVYAPLVADFQIDLTTGQENENIIKFLDLSAGNPENWFWDFGDGNNSTQQNPEHEYSVPGTYSVSLQIWHPADTAQETKADFVVITGLEIDPTIPAQFTLAPNFPNPFNPSTTINFGIPEAGNTKLTIFDVKGAQVSCPLNSWLSPGKYALRIDAGQWVSGIYFYRLEWNNQLMTGKMTLLR